MLRIIRRQVMSVDYGRGMPFDTGDVSSGLKRFGEAGSEELYLDEILALTPLKRTRIYSLRDKGQLGVIRTAPGPTCPRPVFQLFDVAAICEELGYPPPTIEQLQVYRERTRLSAKKENLNTLVKKRAEAKEDFVGLSENPLAKAIVDQERASTFRNDTRSEESSNFAEFIHKRHEEEGPSLIDHWSGDKTKVLLGSEVVSFEKKIWSQERELDRLDSVVSLYEERAAEWEGVKERYREERDLARFEETATRERVVNLEADLRITEASLTRALEDIARETARTKRLTSDLEEQSAAVVRSDIELRVTEGNLAEILMVRDSLREERDIAYEEIRNSQNEVMEVREELAAIRPEMEMLRANTSRGFRRREKRRSKKEKMKRAHESSVIAESSDL